MRSNRLRDTCWPFAAAIPPKSLASLLDCLKLLALVFGTAPGEDPDADEPGPLSALPARRAVDALCAQIGLRPNCHRCKLDALDERQLPLAFLGTDDQWRLLARMNKDEALIQDPHEQNPAVMPIERLQALWSGTVVSAEPARDGADGRHRFDIRWFIPEFMRYRRFVFELLAASAFIELLALVSPIVFQVVMDKVLVNQTMATLQVLVLVMVCVAIMEAGLTCARTYIASQTASRVDARLGSSLFKRLVDLPLSYFKARSVGVTVMRVQELNSIREFLTGAGNTLFIDLGFTCIFFAVMYLYSPTLTAIVALCVPLHLLNALVLSPRLQARIETLFRHGAVNNSLLTETLSGVETVKALALEPQFIDRWETQTRDYVLSTYKVQKLMALSENITLFLQKVTLIAVLWIGARHVIALELSIGQLIAFNMMANHVNKPITRLADVWRQFVQARVSVDRLGDVLNTQPERHVEQQDAEAVSTGDIVLDNVGFRYAPDQEPVLRDFDLTIESGEMIALVGASGSGKSTITKLIQKLYVPEAGCVRIGGADIAGIDAVSLRRQIGVVLQEPFLFSRSVRENIALTNPAAPLDKVIGAAKLAGAHEFIIELPDGYDTILAEEGASLSGGQRQRLAIARVLICEPPVLIFDEATSALDDHSQELVQRNMDGIRSGRTVIIIAHRLSTVRNCDRIIVLDKGAIVEQGSHAQLLARHGHYARLWSLQTGTCRGETGPSRPQTPSSMNVIAATPEGAGQTRMVN